MNFRVIVTLGPSSLQDEKLKEIDALGSCIYRINGAHVNGVQASEIIQKVRGILPSADMMIDLPGNKVRTGNLSQPIRLVKGESFELRPSQVNFSELYKLVKPGDTILANDSVFTLEVQEIRDDTIKIRSHSDGILTRNKGIHVRGISSELPFFFERDLELIETASKLEVEHLSLSFVRTAEDIKEAKKILNRHENSSTQLVSKIETLAAVENLGYILHEVDMINVDRGDLSTDVGMLKLPLIQERIIDSAKRAGKEVFLATQFLKNMEDKPIPLIAEVIDLYKTVKCGVNGIQLSEETAVGKYPVECVKQVFDMYNASFAA